LFPLSEKGDEMMNVLEANHVKIEVQNRLLVSAERLLIGAGDRIGLVGKNGSGKTTLLRVLSGYDNPAGGSVQVKGRVTVLPQLKQIDAQKSGGELTQRLIAEALLEEPKLLLADEPTTHLDTAHIEWLEKQLSSFNGAVLTVSHDRAFLDAVCTVIWELEGGRLRTYSGNYTAYAAQKEEERRRHEIEYETYERTKKGLEQAIAVKEQRAARAVKKPASIGSSEARNMKPHYAKRQKKLQQTAKAIEKRMEKLEKVEKPRKKAPIQMSAAKQESLKGRVVVRAEKLSGKAGLRPLWQPADFIIKGGEKIVLIGSNGSGKTTLLKKIIQGDENLTLAPAARVGYFSQHLDVLEPHLSILENAKGRSGHDEALIRTVLARLGFQREDVFKKVGVLSGGERVKTVLAQLLLSDANMLVLDEPTTFLDTEALEALESLLSEYIGTVLFATHDRRFAEKIAEKVIAIHDRSLHMFDGKLTEYRQKQGMSKRDEQAEGKLVLETKIAEVISRLSIGPSEELEKELERLFEIKRSWK